MINSAELGRQMMMYVKNIKDDTEFNNWCRLAPKLIGLGTATHPKSFKELTDSEQATTNRAIFMLVSKGLITLK